MEREKVGRQIRSIPFKNLKTILYEHRASLCQKCVSLMNEKLAGGHGAFKPHESRTPPETLQQSQENSLFYQTKLVCNLAISCREPVTWSLGSDGSI